VPPIAWGGSAADTGDQVSLPNRIAPGSPSWSPGFTTRRLCPCAAMQSPSPDRKPAVPFNSPLSIMQDLIDTSETAYKKACHFARGNAA